MISGMPSYFPAVPLMALILRIFGSGPAALPDVRTNMPSILLFTLLVIMNTQLLFDFATGSSLGQWVVINDGVMGGRSRGSLGLNEEGHGVFSGEISLENYGGFSSIRCRAGTISVAGYGSVVLRVKGDGKRYQFRIREKQAHYYSYVQYFDTSGAWEDIELPLGDFYPTFRGRNLDLPNFGGNGLEEIGILIGNKKAEKFSLLIDHISLK